LHRTGFQRFVGSAEGSGGSNDAAQQQGGQFHAGVPCQIRQPNGSIAFPDFAYLARTYIKNYANLNKVL
jgi:hypothetical protein